MGHLWKLLAVNSTRLKLLFTSELSIDHCKGCAPSERDFQTKPASQSDGIMRMTRYVCETCLFYHLMLPGCEKKKKVNRLPSFKQDLCDLALRTLYLLRVCAFFCIFLWGMCNGNILNTADRESLGGKNRYCESGTASL